MDIVAFLKYYALILLIFCLSLVMFSVMAFVFIDGEEICVAD
jgi:hypothetical protein